MNTIGYFEIQSSDPAREIEFYSAIFGWNFIKEEFVPIEYYRIETKGINGGLLKRPAAVPPMGTGTNAYVCSIQVENIDRTIEMLLKVGGMMAMEKFAIPGRCWQAYFLDPDHNTVGLFQLDEQAK